MEFIRAFTAIELGEDLKRELRVLQRKLKDVATVRAVRWVAPENIHLTLKFLGDVDAARLPDLTLALEKSAAGIEPFTLMARGLGCFPNARRPNVIWAGLDGQVPRAVEMARRVEDAFSALGFPREPRPFSPHLTLGRVKRDAHPDDRGAIGAAVEQFRVEEYGVLVFDAIHLIKSELRPEGPSYTILATVHLYDSVPRPP